MRFWLRPRLLLAALSYGAYRAYRWWQGPSATALELASVRVVQIGRDGHELGWGSGAVIAPGLILTNGHVANPRDPGERLLSGTLANDKRPTRLRIDVEGSDGIARPEYYAKVAAFDGYVDAAVLVVTSDLDGHHVDARSSDLTHVVAVGESNAVLPGDGLRIIGFPASGGGEEGKHYHRPRDCLRFLG